MPSDIMQWSEKWSAEDHAAFEALCFHRADEVDEPYTELMRAHTIEDREVAEQLVKRAYEENKAEIERANADYEAGIPFGTDPETGEEIFLGGSDVFARAL